MSQTAQVKISSNISPEPCSPSKDIIFTQTSTGSSYNPEERISTKDLTQARAQQVMTIDPYVSLEGDSVNPVQMQVSPELLHRTGQNVIELVESEANVVHLQSGAEINQESKDIKPNSRIAIRRDEYRQDSFKSKMDPVQPVIESKKLDAKLSASVNKPAKWSPTDPLVQSVSRNVLSKPDAFLTNPALMQEASKSKSKSEPVKSILIQVRPKSSRILLKGEPLKTTRETKTVSVYTIENRAYQEPEVRKMNTLGTHVQNHSVRNEDEQSSLKHAPSISTNWAESISKHCFGQNKNSQSLVYTLAIIILVALANAEMAIIPKRNFLEISAQNYITAFNSAALIIFSHHFDYQFIMDESHSMSVKKLLVLFITIFGAWSFIVTTLKLLTMYNLITIPQKSFIFIIILGVNGIFYPTLWLQQPISKRSDKKFKRRFKWFLLYRMAILIAYQVYVITSRLVEKIHIDYQPILVLLLPAMRFGTNKILTKIVDNACGENDLPERYTISCRVACIHALYMTIIIGSKASLATSWVLWLTDAALNLRLCIKIMKLHKNFEDEAQRTKNGYLQHLVTMEILEILQPVCYCMILLMSFYGQNADVLKVTSNKTIDDIIDTIENVGQSLFCELIRISINSLILSKLCDISLISSCLISLINHWKVIAAFIALYTAGFFNITDIRY